VKTGIENDSEVLLIEIIAQSEGNIKGISLTDESYEDFKNYGHMT
jgi:hypothetical protein